MTNLTHEKFWKRSFAVWGHMFAAQLAIGAVIFGFLFIIGLFS